MIFAASGIVRRLLAARFISGVLLVLALSAPSLVRGLATGGIAALAIIPIAASILSWGLALGPACRNPRPSEGLPVPAAYGRHVWEQVWEAGQAHGITPYGTETMHVLRAEKGFIIVGQDTDGTVTPFDAGLDWAVGKKKPDFVGRRSLARPDIVAPGRKQLVGLLTENPNEVLEEGAQIVVDPRQAVPMTMIGHVTSSYWSATLGRSIAMALVQGGSERMGETLHVPMPGRSIAAKVTGVQFYDPEGSRLNG